MNRLSLESSPYLLQHAHNPVDWYPWGDEAFEKARREDKPMIVSIGYAACHWCHVMERESFENEETAAMMNAHFVNVKIDREERPDLDHIYMDAVQAIAGNGGWPLNVFLTPEGKPFYGGTYFPPVPAHNRPSWQQVIQSMAVAYRERRADITEQSDNLTNHLFSSNGFGAKQSNAGNFTPVVMADVYQKIMQTADTVEGGFGQAPKFPQTLTIRFLLQHYYFTKEKAALDQACLSLDKMIAGGINDQLGGGFARYSTDAEWLAPHFEKMLYDNALLVIAISEAYQLTKKPHYKKAIAETMAYAAREMAAPDGGFYSALDADSEGVEGKYYVWTRSEVTELLGADADGFCAYYDITASGNWEGKNILRIDIERLADESGSDRWSAARERLLAARSLRVKPALDDKQLTGWNALMVTAAAKAFAATGIESYRRTALDTMRFLQSKAAGTGMYRYYHTYKNGVAGIPAFLDDYAFLIEALLQLQEITGDTVWLDEAAGLAEYVVKFFRDADSGFFFFTHADQDDVIIRKKEIYDGATPSGNSVMTTNLYQLGILLDRPDWKELVSGLCGGLEQVVNRYPGSFAVWATLMNTLTYGMNEIVLAGEMLNKEHINFLSNYIPNRVFQMAFPGHDAFPLLRNKPLTGIRQYFLCKEYACQNPVNELTALIRLLENP